MDIKTVVTVGDDSKLEVVDEQTEFRYKADQVVTLSGRVATACTDMVRKSTSGTFYNPVLFKIDQKLKLPKEGVCFRSDGKTQVNVDGIEDENVNISNVVLPTLITNNKNQMPEFYNLIGYGNNALKLANATIGSTVHLVGIPKTIRVAGLNLRYIEVVSMDLKRKGGFS